MGKFKNVVLLVIFNYSFCVEIKNFYKKTYGKYFKDIIFYSDTPIVSDKEINYLDIAMGYSIYRVFIDFYYKYNTLLENSDGLMYISDDNIINANMFNEFSKNKIILGYHNPATLSNRSYDNDSNWYWWHTKYGLSAINNLKEDSDFKKYNITTFYRDVNDFFYLPKKYITRELIDLFSIFDRYNVFHEISIPTIIYNLVKDIKKYQTFKFLWLWNDHEKIQVNNNDYILNAFNNEKYFAIHPIKLYKNEEKQKLLENLFS